MVLIFLFLLLIMCLLFFVLFTIFFLFWFFVLFFFFFKQKTAYEMRISDWSSDVCSSDLIGGVIRRYSENRAADRARRIRDPGGPLCAGDREDSRRRPPTFLL